MPRVLSNRATSFWTDLSQHGKWTAPFVGAGFETMAATSVFNCHQTQGVFWIARRGGQRIERHHLFLMEALTPLISACAENARIRQNLFDWHLIDPATALPDRKLLKRMIARRVCAPGSPWALSLIEIDDYDALVEKVGPVMATRVQRRVADLLREQCRASDDIVHYRSNQFVVISDQQDLHDALPYAQRLGRAIREMDLVDGDGRTLRISASVGVAASPDDHHREVPTLQVAEQRLAAVRRAAAQGAHHIDHR
jgi:diguanylate cyclase (GGDEF)-like protein